MSLTETDRPSRETRAPEAAQASRIGLGALLRRYLPFVAICAITGAAAVVALMIALGPSWEASSSVAVQRNYRAILGSTGDFEADPQTLGANAAALARTPGFFQYLTRNGLGASAEDLSDAITSEQVDDSNIISFAATASSETLATQRAEAASTGLAAYSDGLAEAPVRQARQALEAEKASGTADEGTVESLDRYLTRLEALRDISSGVTPLGEATQAQQSRPIPLRDGIQGAVLGIVVALLILALRAGASGRVRLA